LDENFTRDIERRVDYDDYNNIFMDVNSAFWMKLVKREREREREELHTRMLTISQLLQVCFSLASFFFLLHFVEMCVSYNIFFSLLHFVEDVMHHLYY